MQFEVEQKHQVDDPATLIRCLTELGVALGEPIVQSDRYFAHPARDFAQTDEALRIRTVGNASFVTYKGPKLDATSKTRRELELPLAQSDSDGLQFAELLTALGFTPVATVRKRRRKFHIMQDGRDVEGALDEVDGIGTYVELELMADDANLEASKIIISLLANELGERAAAWPDRTSQLSGIAAGGVIARSATTTECRLAFGLHFVASEKGGGFPIAVRRTTETIGESSQTAAKHRDPSFTPWH
jgi:adenylate cyclase class 2